MLRRPPAMPRPPGRIGRPSSSSRAPALHRRGSHTRPAAVIGCAFCPAVQHPVSGHSFAGSIQERGWRWRLSHDGVSQGGGRQVRRFQRLLDCEGCRSSPRPELRAPRATAEIGDTGGWMPTAGAYWRMERAGDHRPDARGDAVARSLFIRQILSLITRSPSPWHARCFEPVERCGQQGRRGPAGLAGRR
jgi:hypothetical protein